MSRQEFEEM